MTNATHASPGAVDDANDPLLAELNGALAAKPLPPPAVTDGAALDPEKDPSTNQPPSFDDALEKAAAEPAQVAHSQRVDKIHSKAAGGFGYKIIVTGEYYAKSIEAKGNVIKHYTLAFNLPSLTNEKKESALGIIVGQSRPSGGMLKNALKKMDPLALAPRTHSIKSVEPLRGAPEPTGIQYMSFQSLKAYVLAHQETIPLDPEDYWNVEDLRTDVIDLLLNRVDNKDARTGEPISDNIKDGRGLGVKKSPLERVRERHAVRKEEHELASMNEGVAS